MRSLERHVPDRRKLSAEKHTGMIQKREQDIHRAFQRIRHATNMNSRM